MRCDDTVDRRVKPVRSNVAVRLCDQGQELTPHYVLVHHTIQEQNTVETVETCKYGVIQHEHNGFVDHVFFY